MNSQNSPDARRISYPSKLRGRVEPLRDRMKVVNDLQKNRPEEEFLGLSSDRYGHEMAVTRAANSTAVPAGEIESR